MLRSNSCRCSNSLTSGILSVVGLFLASAFATAAAPSRFTDSDYTRHVAQLKKERLPEGFHVVIQKPFVVIGDGSEGDVRDYARNTVKWAVDRLKQDYFKLDPEFILEVWLFEDKESYEKHVPELFGSKPTTPYGYYSRKDRALIMNIGTGTGTLVHEIVHPFIEANFPKCPAWFNEGLASLYEQCGEEDGHIRGYPNWRLTGLKKAIAADRVPSFQAMCETSTHEFYTDNRGVNYAQARYLCYYLQEQEKLIDFYHAFRKAAADDPSGYQTLHRILEEEDMDAFHARWQKSVMKLER